MPGLSLFVCSNSSARLVCQALGRRPGLVPGARNSIEGQQGETLARGYVRWDLKKASRSDRRVCAMGLSQIISKETRRGGENGPGLGDKAPDGEAEAEKGWSPESQGPDARLCSFKRFLLCFFSSLPSSPSV